MDTNTAQQGKDIHSIKRQEKQARRSKAIQFGKDMHSIKRQEKQAGAARQSRSYQQLTLEGSL